MPLGARTLRDDGPVRFVAPPLEATRIDARADIEAQFEAARQDGFARGYDDGIARAEAEVRAVEQEHRAAHDRCLQAARALEAAAADLRSRDAVALQAIEDDVVALALALATEIVGRELRSTDAPVRDAIQRAIALAPDRGTASCRVHPDDAEVAHEVVAGDPLRQDRVDVLPDPRVERGGCVVEVGECRIDAQVGTAIERMRQALA